MAYSKLFPNLVPCGYRLREPVKPHSVENPLHFFRRPFFNAEDPAIAYRALLFTYHTLHIICTFFHNELNHCYFRHRIKVVFGLCRCNCPWAKY